jgi:hypothetical protein
MGQRWLLGAAVMVVLASGAKSFGAELRIPDDRLLYKDVVGKVVDPGTGKPLAGVPVSLLYETAVTDEKGSFRFAKVPLTHTAQVSLRVRSRTGYIIGCITVDVPVRFYPLAVAVTEKIVKDGVVTVLEKADVRIVEPATDEVLTLQPKLVPASAVDRFCGACHDRNPCLETATFQEVVKSGTADLRGIIVNEDEVEDYKKRLLQQGLRRETYQRIRYQDSHPDGMNMAVIPKLELPQYKGLFRRPQALRLVDEKLVTCDTCHTRHLPAEQRQYVVMSFEKDSALCTQCHL